MRIHPKRACSSQMKVRAASIAEVESINLPDSPYEKNLEEVKVDPHACHPEHCVSSLARRCCNFAPARGGKRPRASAGGTFKPCVPPFPEEAVEEITMVSSGGATSARGFLSKPGEKLRGSSSGLRQVEALQE